MARAGCLFFLFIIGVMGAELYVVLKLIDYFEDVPVVIAAVVALSIVGYKLLMFHKNRLMAAFVQNKAGSRIIGMVGAVLLILPGFITGAIGLILQIPLVQSLFGRIGNALMASVMKRAMGGAFGKGFPGAGFPSGGFPGAGFPGGFPGVFPGGFPKPDDQVSTSGKIGNLKVNFPGPHSNKSTPKTYDVKPDKPE